MPLLPLNRSGLPIGKSLLLYFYRVFLDLECQRKFCVCGLEISVSLDKPLIVAPGKGNYKPYCQGTYTSDDPGWFDG